MVLDVPLSSPSPHLEYALESASNDASGFALFDLNKREPFKSVLRRVLDGTSVQAMKPSDLHDWENNWRESNKQPVFKILIQEYGPFDKLISDFGVVKVMGRWRGGNFQKTFQVTTPDGLPKAIKEAQGFIEETIQRQGG